MGVPGQYSQPQTSPFTACRPAKSTVMGGLPAKGAPCPAGPLPDMPLPVPSPGPPEPSAPAPWLVNRAAASS